MTEDELRRAGDALAAALINALAYVPEGRTRLQGFAALNDWPHTSTRGLYPNHARGWLIYSNGRPS